VRGLDQPVGQGGLPVIDMGDDAEVAKGVHVSAGRRKAAVSPQDAAGKLTPKAFPDILDMIQSLIT
jgi:hypothetical protein